MAKIIKGPDSHPVSTEKLASGELATTQAVRLFVAINLPSNVAEAVAKQQDFIRSTLTSVNPRDRGLRWVHPEFIHLTLLFLGDVHSARLEDVKSALRLACAESSCFDLRLSSLGCFPNVRRPRVLWMGVEGDTAALQQLQMQVSTYLQPFVAKPDEKKFHPHLTLARIKAENKKLCHQIGEATQGMAKVGRGIAWTVGSVELMRSVLKPSGSEYSVEESIPLEEN